MPPARRKANSSGDGTIYGVGAVERVISILKAFDGANAELSLQQVEAATKLPKSTAFRLLDNLMRGNLISRDRSTGLYRLGLGLLPLAEKAKSSFSLVEYALPVMRKIRSSLNETSYVSVRVDDQRFDVEQVVGLQGLRRVLELGVAKPLYAGSASKVLLSAMADEEIEGYLKRVKLKRISTGTIVETAVLWKDIRKIRNIGYAEGRSELNPGGIGVAAPIYGITNEVVGTLGITVPSPRFTDELGSLAVQNAKLITSGIKAAQRLSSRR